MDVEKLREQIAELEAMSRQVDRDDERIMDGASERLDDVLRQMERVRGDAEAGEEDAEQVYLALVQEAGELRQMIAEVQARVSKS